MNNVQRTINLLLKDNNIPKQLKNLDDKFKLLDDSMMKLNQTVDLTSTPCVGLLAKTIKLFVCIPDCFNLLLKEIVSKNG